MKVSLGLTRSHGTNPGRSQVSHPFRGETSETFEPLNPSEMHQKCQETPMTEPAPPAPCSNCSMSLGCCESLPTPCCDTCFHPDDTQDQA